jgi:hypothetical protein
MKSDMTTASRQDDLHAGHILILQGTARQNWPSFVQQFSGLAKVDRVRVCDAFERIGVSSL